MRYWAWPCLILLAAAIAACGGPAANIARLTPVAALPQPSLPPWIASIAPTGKVETLAQIRIIFAKPVAPVTALSAGGPQNVLRHISIEPALQGHFTLLTPRMVGFVADQALPVGTRVRITLEQGLSDLEGDTLQRDLSWTFETAQLRFTSLPQLAVAAEDASSPAPVGLRPTLNLTANASTDLSSFAAHTTLIAGADRIGVAVTLESAPTPDPGSDAQALFDPSLDTWTYRVRPVRDLRRATTYSLHIAPGVAPVYGNLPTSQAFNGGLRTFDALSIVPTARPSPDGEGRFAGGDPAIAFSNPLDVKSVAGAVTISPAPSAMKDLVSVPDQSNLVVIDPYALDPNTAYTATIAATVKDVFGQTLGASQRVAIRTSDFAAGAWAPTGTTVIPAGAPIALNFYATNLPNNSYAAAYAALTPLQLLASGSSLSFLPPPKSWRDYTLNAARRNVQSVVRIPLRAKIGGPYGALAYGFRTALDAQDSEPGLVGKVQLTNLGIFAQWFPARGIVRVQHLSDGAAVRAAKVSVYRIDDDSKIAPAQCAEGSTNPNGEVEFSGVDVERCSVLAKENEAPSLGVVVSEGTDVATVTMSSYSGITRFDVSSGWTSGAPLARGTIFSDRQMYQPGERGEITGVAYYVRGTKVVADRNALYKVRLIDPENNAALLGRVRTDDYGVFAMPVVFSKQQGLGYYTVDAKGSNGNEISGSFRLAQFRPPNFKLTLTLAAKTATAGSSVRAGIAAAYLFGAPLQGGTAHAYVSRDVATVQPKGWDEFMFGPQWFWPERTPTFDTDVLQRDFALDSQGNGSLDVAVPAKLPFPMTYRVDMETTDVSNLSAADSQSFLALGSDAVIGLSSDAVTKSGTPMLIRTIVTDADGKAIPGRPVHLELQKMTYTAATQQVEGGQDAQQAIKYDTVAAADVTSASSPITAALTANAVGPYRVRATFASGDTSNSDQSEASATEIQVFAFGPGEADWGLSDSNAVAVKLDKKQYAIGDTASALIASPYTRADIYVAVVRGDSLYHTTLRNVSGAARVHFKVTAEMLPNAALQAVVVRRRTASDTRGPDTLALTGMAGFDVDIAARYLRLNIAARDATIRPGGRQELHFVLSDRNGAGARGEIVAMVVNDAILQLSGYRLPDLVQTVFATQPISTIFSDNRENVTLKTQTAPLEKGFGYGGGYLAGAASTRIRANFLPLAFYGVMHTDAAGRARAAFTMPDDLTTWRVMAVALAQLPATARDADWHFATADRTFVSNQPLIASPLLPQFARPGDRFELGVSIANQTGASGALDLALRLGGALHFVQGDPSTTYARQEAATGIRALRFPVVVGAPAPTTVTGTAALNDRKDAFRVPFFASERAVSASVIESGTTRNEAAIPIALGSGGSLQLTLANSIVPQFALPAQRMIENEALPLADEAASRLIAASALARLRNPYRLSLTFDPAEASHAALQRLLSFQRGDGGFGEFANDPQSEPFTTAAALDALTFARARGVTVDSGATASAVNFMMQTLANPARFKWCASDATCKARLRFESLWSLAANGHRRTDFLSDIVGQQNAFDSATQIRLARYLLKTPGWQGPGRALADRLEQTLYVTGRYAVANLANPWGREGSLVDAQSQMLQLLIERGGPSEQIDGAVRALMAQRCKCGWPTTDNTASALIALTEYAATERLARGSAAARVGGRTIATMRFDDRAAAQTFAVPAATLHGDRVVITAKGTVHFTLLYTYPVPPDAPGELAAFRVVRVLTDPGGATSGKRPPLATMDLSAAAPIDVTAGRVFDVGVRAIVDHAVDRLMIEDPIPAGFEAVDTTFRTALQSVIPQSNSWQIDASEIYRDRVVAFAQHLDPGVYDLHYLVRSVTPGRYAWPGARAYLLDAPEEFGRSSAALLQVNP